MKIAALLAGLFSGIIGSMGLGGGAVLIIYLTLFTDTKQLTAQGINLLYFIPIAVFSVIVYNFKKMIVWKTVIKISVFGILGTLLGWFLADFVGGEWTSKIFGGLIIILGIKEFFAKGGKTVAEKEK